MTVANSGQHSRRFYKICRPGNDSWGQLGLVWHHAILECGDDGISIIHERVEEHAGLTSRPLDVHERWEIGKLIADEQAAIRRLEEVRQWGPYSLFSSNCEHAVNYIATGFSRSSQVLIGFSAILALASILIGPQIKKRAALT